MIPIKDVTKEGYYNDGRAIAGQRMKLGHNVSWFKAFAASGFMKDQMRQASFNGTSGEVVEDVNGWFDCSAVGFTVADYMPWQSTEGRQEGRWIIRWNGTGTVELNFSSLFESGANYNIYDVPADKHNYFATASDGYPTEITIVRVEEEADFLAGNNIDKTFLENISGASVIRYMDAMDTNSSNVVSYSEYTEGFYKFSQVPYMPMAFIAEISNRSGSDPWLCIPAMANDACITSLANALFSDLDTDKKVYVEYGNEIWNFAPGFSNSNNWNLLGDIPVFNPTVNPTLASVNQVAHGLTTGDEIKLFNQPTHSVFPFAFGAAAFVIVDDVDNFRLSDSNANALIDVDLAPIDSRVTKIRYKITADAVFDENYNYALRSTECWDIFVSVFGSDRVVKIGAGQSSFTVRTQNLIDSYAPFREQMDFFAIAPYFEITGLASYETATLSEIQTYLTEVNFPARAATTVEHGEILGRNIVVCYEGGDHSKIDGATVPQQEKVEEWTVSTEAGESFTEYLEMLVGAGVKLFDHFTMVEPIAGGDAFGLMQTPDDVTATKKVAYDVQISKGGVGK